MQTRIEPPVLLSRLLLFVFAGTVVVLFVLFMTIGKMFPLNRPEVFFINSKPLDTTVVQISELPPDDANFEMFKIAFVMEYIRARNDVMDNTALMRQKWGNASGVVAAWSTKPVYTGFQKTAMVRAIMNDIPDFAFTCSVNFLGRVLSLQNNQYTARIRYSCADKNGQTDDHDYTIVVGLRVIDNADMAWTETLNNPLGLVVDKYDIQGNTGDPLDTGFLR